MKNSRVYIILGIVFIFLCFFVSPLYVGLALKLGLLEAWLYVLPIFLGIIVSVTMAAGKSLRLALKACVGFVILTLFPFTAFIIVLPTLYQVLSITLIAFTVSLLVYAYRKRRRPRLRKATLSKENLRAKRQKLTRYDFCACVFGGKVLSPNPNPNTHTSLSSR